MLKKIVFFGILTLLFISCVQKEKENKVTYNKEILPETKVFQGVGLLGDSLFTEIDSVSQSEQINKLVEAESLFGEDPSLENLIWIGRREAYLGRYDLAIRTFSKAAKQFPESFEPLRHRGHRFISIREFERALVDFLEAGELMKDLPLQIEQDGMPNKLNIPLSNGQFNVWYHLGLAYYLLNDWEKALDAYKQCLEVSDNDDLIVATLDWYYMTLMKLGKTKEAQSLIKAVNTNMKIIENDAYYKRILMYKGQLNPEDLMDVGTESEDQKLQYVTQGYGLGNFYLSQGDTAKAKSIFEKVIDSGYWSAFGYIASEMELARLKNE
ncbi:tetratricopeptide repeat protein [Aquiflexum gelatinilyticum]|uniref:Tetratricopeptide repeat protein n=1 Tax=Aquiflexum gelatinilyticum TaxID=2961943 RepID=A0A9X2SZZ5_9BACT|nr:tetratricopeptide repeat protein [Aquiflexum gelatinilyticum]MCR9015093.1 tetratricopeptide repeat protein [Aquiflexum gelatinilyticum]